MKLLTKNVAVNSLTESNQIVCIQPKQSKDFSQKAVLTQLSKTPLSNQIGKFLLDEDDLDDRFEIEPKFNKLEIIINNFLLILFTIVAGIIASCVSPSFLATRIKFFYHKITQKNSNC